MFFKNTLVKNPVLDKELLIKFRYKRFFWIAAIYVLCAFVITLYYLNIISGIGYRTYEITRLPELARGIFIFLSFWQLIIISIITLSFTAACITSEKEQNTISLLFSSQLTSKMIIYGKFYTSVLYNLLTILILLPLISVIFILGGISLSEIIYSSLLILLGTSFFSAIAVFFSTIFKKTTMASVMSVLIGFGFVLGPLIIPPLFLSSLSISKAYSPTLYKDIMVILQHFNPAYPLILLFEKGSVLSGSVFKSHNYLTFLLTSAGTVLLLMFILLGLSVLILKKKSIKS